MTEHNTTPGRAATAEATPQDRRAGKVAILLVAGVAGAALFIYVGIIVYGLMVGT